MDEHIAISGPQNAFVFRMYKLKEVKKGFVEIVTKCR
jgi:hypothetical protein